MVPDVVYPGVAIETFMKCYTYKELSEKSKIKYASLLRKMKGISPFTIEEAKSIQKALDCKKPLEILFIKKGER